MSVFLKKRMIVGMSLVFVWAATIGCCESGFADILSGLNTSLCCPEPCHSSGDESFPLDESCRCQDAFAIQRLSEKVSFDPTENRLSAWVGSGVDLMSGSKPFAGSLLTKTLGRERSRRLLYILHSVYRL